MARLRPPSSAPHGLRGAVACLLLGSACAASEPVDNGIDGLPEAGAAGAPPSSSGGGLGGTSAGAPSAGAASGGKSIIAGGGRGTSGAAGTTFTEYPCPIERIAVDPADLPGACNQSFPYDLFEGREFDAQLVNVSLVFADTADRWLLGWVSGEQQCEAENGWYYVDDSYAISLCPVSCELLTEHGGGEIDVQVGCVNMARSE